jgi:hypothetical protein
LSLIAFGALLHGKAYKEAVWEPIDAMLYSGARHAEQYCPCYGSAADPARRGHSIDSLYRQRVGHRL